MSKMSIDDLDGEENSCSSSNCSNPAVFRISMPEGDDVFLCDACASACFQNIIENIDA